MVRKGTFIYIFSSLLVSFEVLMCRFSDSFPFLSFHKSIKEVSEFSHLLQTAYISYFMGKKIRIKVLGMLKQNMKKSRCDFTTTFISSDPTLPFVVFFFLFHFSSPLYFIDDLQFGEESGLIPDICIQIY